MSFRIHWLFFGFVVFYLFFINRSDDGVPRYRAFLALALLCCLDLYS
jgi:hypothetical protein